MAVLFLLNYHKILQTLYGRIYWHLFTQCIAYRIIPDSTLNAYCKFEIIPDKHTSSIVHQQQQSPGKFNAVITPIKLDVKTLIASISDGTLANYCKIPPVRPRGILGPFDEGFIKLEHFCNVHNENGHNLWNVATQSYRWKSFSLYSVKNASYSTFSLPRNLFQ